jgi:hypothetical protein
VAAEPMFAGEQAQKGRCVLEADCVQRVNKASKVLCIACDQWQPEKRQRSHNDVIGSTPLPGTTTACWCF